MTTLEKAQEYMKDVYRFYDEFAGKSGYNPFFFLQREVDPLNEALKDSRKHNEDLFKKIMAIPREEKLAIAPEIKPDERKIRVGRI